MGARVPNSADGHYSPCGHSPVAFRIRRNPPHTVLEPKLGLAATRARIQFQPGSGGWECIRARVCQRIKVVYSLPFSRDRSERNAKWTKCSDGQPRSSCRTPLVSPLIQVTRQLCNRRCALIRPSGCIRIIERMIDHKRLGDVSQHSRKDRKVIQILNFF